MDPFKVMQSGSRVDSHLPKLITLNPLKVTLVLLTSEGRRNGIWHWQLSTKAHSGFFSLFSRGRGAEFLPANRKIKVLCCAVPKSAPRRLILEFTKDTWSPIWRLHPYTSQNSAYGPDLGRNTYKHMPKLNYTSRVPSSLAEVCTLHR